MRFPRLSHQPPRRCGEAVDRRHQQRDVLWTRQAVVAVLDQGDDDIAAGQALGEAQAQLPRHRFVAQPVQQPYWHVERARVGTTREVPVEVVVNGVAVNSRNVNADGATRDVEFDVPLERSSWVTLRVLPSSYSM